MSVRRFKGRGPMSETMEEPADTAGADGATSTLTDEQHEWVSSFTGMDTRAGAAAPAPASNDAPGGFFSSIADAVSGAVSSGVSAVSDAVSSVTEVATPAQPPASADDQGTDGRSSSGVL